MPKDKEKKKPRKSEVEEDDKDVVTVVEDVEMADGTVSSPVSA
jgi:hypothetical protein